jgi:hypothetical protein
MTSRLLIVRGDDTREVELSAYLDAEAMETAERDAIRWIKALRHASVDGRPLRARFTYRGDSLWWFAELYLHKQGTVAAIYRSILALGTLAAQEEPSEVRAIATDRVVDVVAPQVLGARGIRWRGSRAGRTRDRFSQAWRAFFYTAEAKVRRIGRGSRQAKAWQHKAEPNSQPAVAAFVHAAFWRRDPSAALAGDEGYIGPILQELATRVGAKGLALVGVGPRTNFRARRWWHRLAEFRDPDGRSIALTPIEAFAGWGDLAGSREVWRTRADTRRALLCSADLRRAATIRGCDAWPLVSDELAGISHLQFPWSARAMDEAGAALDRIRPRVAVTYAEAGGWGRALALEARRRAIPFVGLQHGFIYRHWLNYLHEPDEMTGAASNDPGFPRPDLTLVYDGAARDHLLDAGRFPPDTVAVTGSPRLDALVTAIAALTLERKAAVRRSVGAKEEDAIVLLAAKHAQLRGAFAALARAVSLMARTRLVVKPHPAETEAPYVRDAGGLTQIEVAPRSANLADLLGVADLIVTANSTVALDAMVLGIPALVVALPNNLSPFVEAGVMAGARTDGEIADQLAALVYDRGRRARLADAARAFMARHAIGADGQAASRAADIILELSKRR